jgi:uncharacterized repeat protein (TIGR02543 family)
MATDTKPNPVVLTGASDRKTSQSVSWRGAGAAPESVQCVPAASYAGDSSFAGASAKTAVGAQTAITSGGITQYWNKATIAGLSPSTKYYYRAGRPGAWSDTHSFTTAARKAGDFGFLYFGDVQRDSGTAEQEYPEFGKLVKAAAAKSAGAAFGLFGGDMVDGGSDMTDWKYFLSYAQGAFSDIPMYAAIGNHESNFASGKPEYMLKLLSFPQNGPDGFKGEFYSFDYGKAHITVLNSWALSDEQGVYEDKKVGGEVADSEKLEKLNNWIKDDLAAADAAKFKIVVMHHPAYPMATDAVSARVLEQWEPLVVEGGVDLALVGHQHVYGRTPPLAGGDVMKGEDAAGGVVYVMGNSGLKYYATGDPTYYEKQIFGTPTYQQVSISGDTLTLRTFDKGGRELDSWSKTSQTADEPRDVNGDNRVDMNDVTEAKSAVLGGEAYDPALDVNGDGKVDIRDAQFIQLHVKGTAPGNAAAPSGSFAFGLSAAGAGAFSAKAAATALSTIPAGGKVRVTASLTAGGGFTFYAGQYRIALPAGAAAGNIAAQNGWECGVSQSGGSTVLTFAKLEGSVSGAPCPAYSAIATFDISPPPSLAAGQAFSIDCLGSLLTDDVAFEVNRVSGGGLALTVESPQQGATPDSVDNGAGGGQNAAETVALNTAGGTKATAKVGDTLGSVAKPTKKGYNFNGWFTKPKGGKKLSPSYVVKAGDKIYAQWTAKKFKLTFALNKGKLKGKNYKTVAYDAKYGKLPTPTRKGYKFAGWYTKPKGGKKITATSKVQLLKNTKVYAQWQKK